MQNKNKILILSQFTSHLLVKTILVSLTIKVLISGALFLISPYTVYAQDNAINPETLISLTNQERNKYELPALQTNDELTLAAKNKANDMLQKNYFAHTTPDKQPFYSWIHDVEYSYKSAGENLAIDFTQNAPIVKAWMNSPTHKENILDPNYQEIGIAVVTGVFENRRSTIVIQMFGQPSIPIVLAPANEENVMGASVSRTDLRTNGSTALWSKRINRILNLSVLLIFSSLAIIITEKTLFHKQNFLLKN